MLPALAFYLLLAVVLTDHTALVRDEVRYWGLAENLLNGHFHDKSGDNFLWSGPGYPVLLAPFVAVDAPLVLPKMFNGVLYYIAMVMFFKLMALYLPRRKAWLAALIMLAYYPPLEHSMGDIMTEALAICLMTSTAYFFCQALQQAQYRWRDMVLPAALLMWLMLTKVIFGYVVLAALLGFGLLALLRKDNPKLAASVRFFALGLAFCLPFLIYTFSLTGKLFYWGNSGGMQLYWMSSPYPDELGDWHSPNLQEHPSLMEHHGAFYASLQDLTPVQRDEAFKRQALANIKAHPKKFVLNWISNMGRTIFSHPLSFLKPSNGVFKYVFPHMFLLVLGILFAYPTFRHHRLFPTEILVLLVFCGIYFFGTSLLASYVRFFYLITPILMLWLGFALHRFVQVRFTPTAAGDTSL